MDGDKTEFVDETVLKTPKPTATSTVYKRKKTSSQKTRLENTEPENSLGIINESGLLEVSKDQIHSISAADLSHELNQQRILANNSLQRANKVAGLPSKYLRPNLSNSSYSNINLTNDSTFNESDVMKSPRKSPKNTSTPRTSLVLNSSEQSSEPRLSLGKSIAKLSHQVINPDMSIDNFLKEFKKTMNSVDKEVSPVDVFHPAEEAASMLLADEMSWRRKNEIPVANSLFQESSRDTSYGKVSVGAFFQQKSDTISDLQMLRSPEKPKKPVPLIDSSISFAEVTKNSVQSDNSSIGFTGNASKNHKSLSISAIQKFLAQTEDTPRKVTSFLLKQGQKVSESSIDQCSLPVSKSSIDQCSLPVSKNSSYTSNYSDNEAMRQLVADKENIDTYNIPQRDLEIKGDVPSSDSHERPLSAGSSRSVSSALTSLPNGKLPIESTKTELIWGCVKVDKCVTQEFLLRNRTSKRLCLQMSISGYEFKIRKDNRQESELLSATKILLHPHESRAIIVSFIPTKIGAAVDELSFTSLDPNLQQTKKQSVRLYGYGGFGKVDILNLTKDVTGKFWLSLGKLSNDNIIIQKIVLRNNGTLPCFVCITFNPKDLFPFANFSVSPNFCVLIPNEQKEITVTFVLTMEGHQILQKMFTNTLVAEIGNLLIISGTEANRGRLRRQCRKCEEKGLDIDPISNILKEKIKGESMPADLSFFKEAPGNLKEILMLFTRNVVVVTIEQDPEITIMPQYPDESGMFQTLCQDNTTLCLENTTTVQASCKLEPSSIILTPPTKMKDSFFLISECKKKLHFEVVSDPEGLEISPKDGVIAPSQEIVINVASHKMSTREKKVFKVLVYVENEVFEASVKIMFIQTKNK